MEIAYKTDLPKETTTRQKILEAAFDEIHTHGFQGMRIDRILKASSLAKGALYHHFPTKQQLGYAVVDELLGLHIKQLWIDPLKLDGDPIAEMQGVVRFYFKQFGPHVVKNGCPLINLSQEMPALDDGFRTRLSKIYAQWIAAIVGSIEVGQNQGVIKKNIDPDTIAKFIISSFQGITIGVKCTQSQQNFEKLSETLIDYIESLRA